MMPFFDRFFSLRPTSFGTRLQTLKMMKVINRLFDQEPELNAILEIGPGWGEFASFCAGLNLNYFAVEANHKMAAVLRGSGQDVLISNVPPIPLGSGFFDAVIALNVLEHMPDLLNAIGFVQEMVRVLRPGGLVCVNCPDLLATGNLFWDADYTHNFPTSRNRLIQLFNDQNLTVVDDTYFSGPLSGIVATPLSWTARIFPETLVSTFVRRWVDPDRIRRAKLTLLRNIFIIGRKE